jgi:hypothetical protein
MVRLTSKVNASFLSTKMCKGRRQGSVERLAAGGLYHRTGSWDVMHRVCLSIEDFCHLRTWFGDEVIICTGTPDLAPSYFRLVNRMNRKFGNS